ncbi:MAG: hypothetical protein GX774_15595 [Armatimonadetes bacterium]|nr:hypothetical protein [Armatimonadota bacterium]
MEKFIFGLSAAIFAAGVLCAEVAAQEQPPTVAPAINDLPADAPVGQRPYEMEWAKRVEERTPLVDFEDLTGWTVELYDGAECELSRSREQQMWGRYVAKVKYRGTGSGSRFTIRPPQPLPIQGTFDCINLWMYGNRMDYGPPPDTPPVSLTALFVDDAGKEFAVGLTTVRWEEWWLVHRRIDAETLKAIRCPCRFTGLEFRGGSQTPWRALYIDSLSFYTEELKPLHFEPRPRRNLTLFEGQSPGLNTGPGKLDFPTREETILPTNFTRKFKTTARRLPASGMYEFRYAGSDAQVAYRIDPAQGFSGIEAFVDGKRVSQPMRDGGIKFEPEAKLTLRSAKLQDGVLTAEYEPGVTYRFRLWQKSLVIDVLCPGGRATEVSFGRFAGLHAPETIYVPFMAWTNGPQVLMSRAGSDTGPAVFATVYADWYRSNASECHVAVSVAGDTAEVNGGVRYRPRTDGVRNDVFERIFLTVSPTFEEVLPTIANPRGLHAPQAAERLWRESWGPGDFEKEQELSVKRRAYGIEKLTQCNHEISWRDGGESFTMRIHAAPKKGGDEKQAWYVKAQQALGWFSGLYTNYTDYAPVNSHWDEDWVARDSSNEWRPAWARNYNCKPSRAVEIEHKLAPIIKEKYGVNASYTDVHTAVAPWGYCDYDARVPGAGTFAQTFYCYGELLRNDSKVYGGPVFSEGTYQMLYAGLADGNYGLVYNGIPLATQPYLPAFDLHKIHPLECDIGVSWTSFFCEAIPNWRAPENLERSIDRFLAAQMVYGHIGWLLEDEFGTGLQCRSYYLMQQLQSRYGLKAPTAIDYNDDGRYVNTSQAVASGKYRDSQIRIRYPGGLTLWVNGNETKEWRVEDAQLRRRLGECVLPPFGWVAVAPGFLEYSGLKDGRRIDFVQSPEYWYFDGRGSSLAHGGLACQGGIAVRKLAPNRVEVIDCADSREFGLRRPFGISGVVLEAEAFDVQGNSLGKAEVRHTADLDWVVGIEKAMRYVVTFGPARGALRVRADLAVVPPGGTVTLEGAGATFTCEDARVEGGTLQVPADVPVGSSLWVKGEAAGRSGWTVLPVVPLVEVKVDPPVVRLPASEAEVTLRGRIHPPAAGVTGATLSLSTPPWLVATPETFAVERDFTRTVKLSLKGAPEKSAGMLVLTVKAGDLSQEVSVPIWLAPSSVVVRRLDDPAWSFNWGQAFRGGTEQSGDTKTGATFHRSADYTVGGVRKPGLFAHPPYNGGAGYAFATFTPLQLPTEPTELSVFLGLGDGGVTSDGVDYTVIVRDEDGRETKLFTEHGDQGRWREVTADLSAFAGRKVTFRLIADCGASDDTKADWACWGDPVIRLKRPVPELKLGR